MRRKGPQMTGRRHPSPRAGLAAVLIALALPFSVAASSRLTGG